MREAFKDFDRDPCEIEKVKFYTCSEKPFTKTEVMEVQQSKLVLCMRPTRQIKEEEKTAMRMMSALLGGTPTSKLFLNVREKLSLCYYCSSKYMSMSDIMLVDCGVEDKNVKKTGEAIIRELESIKEGKFTQEEIENTKKLLINSLNSVEDSPSAPEEWHMRDLAEGRTITPEKMKQEIKETTAQQIRQAAELMELEGIYLLTGEEKQNGN